MGEPQMRTICQIVIDVKEHSLHSKMDGPLRRHQHSADPPNLPFPTNDNENATTKREERRRVDGRALSAGKPMTANALNVMCKESKQRSTFTTKCTKNSKRKKNEKIH